MAKASLALAFMSGLVSSGQFLAPKNLVKQIGAMNLKQVQLSHRNGNTIWPIVEDFRLPLLLVPFRSV